MAEHVRHWDPVALTYVPTGQQCPRFRMDGLLQPNTEILLGERIWQVHGAPGHDPHSVILFEPESGVLISADALWANGFGIVFQELEGQEAFDEVGATLDLIESLRPRIVIPGHGPVFTDFESALAAARRRLDGFVQDPTRHAAHAAKVLLKFKLLELQRQRMARPAALGCRHALCRNGAPALVFGYDPAKPGSSGWRMTWCAPARRGARRVASERLRALPDSGGDSAIRSNQVAVAIQSPKKQKAQHFCWAFRAVRA